MIFNSNIQTRLEINGPILSFDDGIAFQPISIVRDGGGTATFSGLATATFPEQVPPNPAENSGYISYQWYEVDVGPVSNDGRTTGADTNTLTISNLVTPGDNNRQFYLKADYINSAYSLPVGSAVTVGTAKSTGNALNDGLDSNIVRLSVNTELQIDSQPEGNTIPQGSQHCFSVGATLKDSTEGLENIQYQWEVNDVEIVDGEYSQSVQETSTEFVRGVASGYSSPGIYLDLSTIVGSVSVTFSTSEESGIFHYINVPGVKNFPENNGSQTFNLSGGTVYGPCSAPNGGLYIGSETPVGGDNRLVVEEGGDDWNDMILSVNTGVFRRLNSAPEAIVQQSSTTSTVNRSLVYTGSKTNTLCVTSGIISDDRYRVKISHPTATNSPLYSASARLNVVSSRQIINFEYIDQTPAILSGKESINFFNVDQHVLDANNPVIKGIIRFYAPERDVNIVMELFAARGFSNGSYVGGEGGYSRIKFTVRQGEEYIINNIPQANSSGSIFIYHKQSLLCCAAAGGSAGNAGNGGPGGGVNVAGGSGQGRGAGTGGILWEAGTLPFPGIFGSTADFAATSGFLLGGDGVASIPNGGRIIPCPRGGYWRQRGFSPCQEIGTQIFVNAEGRSVSGTAAIDSGFKAGYGIRNTAGRGVNGGGSGGNGATGGNGGNGGGGGGGGGGYNSGGVEVLETQQGGNTGIAKVIFRLGDLTV